MTDPDEGRDVDRLGNAGVEPGDTDEEPPTIACRRCDREWTLEAELATVGNQAFEQFALDHRHHTGHFPDGVETWRAVCRHCPEEAERLSETGARRWAETHVRHTRHEVELRSATADEVELLQVETLEE